MSKNKQQKFAEMQTFKNVMQPDIKKTLSTDNATKGRWNSLIFNNLNPVVLELGCGKGEYTVELAKKYPEKNFIGIDIKGARIWRGAKIALQNKLSNVFFLRTKIDFIDKFFDSNEITEIWIPHPDPQPKKANKRLTSPFFLRLYQKIIKNNSIIHLKTDNYLLYQYTLDLLKKNNIRPLENYNDIHQLKKQTDINIIKTHYEKMFIETGVKITYLSFRLNNKHEILSPDNIAIPNYKYR